MRFQEIQNAYQALLPRAPKNITALWDELVSAGLEDGTPEKDGFYHNFPFLAVFSMTAGAVGWHVADEPGNWALFSMAVAAATYGYKGGNTAAAWRVESAFRLLVWLYWLGLLSWGLWLAVRKIAGI